MTDVQESGPSWYRPKFMNSTIEILPRVRNLKTDSFGNGSGPRFLARLKKATRQPNDTVELQVRGVQSSRRVRKRFAKVSLCGQAKHAHDKYADCHQWNLLQPIIHDCFPCNRLPEGPDRKAQQSLKSIACARAFGPHDRLILGMDCF